MEWTWSSLHSWKNVAHVLFSFFFIARTTLLWSIFTITSFKQCFSTVLVHNFRGWIIGKLARSCAGHVHPPFKTNTPFSSNMPTFLFLGSSSTADAWTNIWDNHAAKNFSCWGAGLVACRMHLHVTACFIIEHGEKYVLFS